jgi:hypothetical protein
VRDRGPGRTVPGDALPAVGGHQTLHGARGDADVLTVYMSPHFRGPVQRFWWPFAVTVPDVYSGKYFREYEIR